MAFTPEDGTGLANATSLCTVAAADAILASRLHTADWPATSLGADLAKKQAALEWFSRILGRLQWRGLRLNKTQAMPWPRREVPVRDPVDYTDVYASDAVPAFVIEAVAIGAMRACAVDPLLPDPDNAGISSLSAGPLSLTYDTSSTASSNGDPWLDEEVRGIIEHALVSGAVAGERGYKPAVRV